MSLDLIRSRVQAGVPASATSHSLSSNKIVSLIKSHETVLETDKTYQIVH